MNALLSPARLRPPDVLRVGSAGLRTRPLRVFLSALGIAIGIAAMIAVVGISSSSRAEVDRQLAALGTNLLTVAPGNTLLGGEATLPVESVSMISRIGPVASSISGHVETVGTRRIVSIWSRKTCELRGFAFGSRNASDWATACSDGTVRPVLATIR